jgi:YD repeat-containing protein
MLMLGTTKLATASGLISPFDMSPTGRDCVGNQSIRFSALIVRMRDLAVAATLWFTLVSLGSAQTVGYGPLGGPYSYTTGQAYCQVASIPPPPGSVSAGLYSQPAFTLVGVSFPNYLGNCGHIYDGPGCAGGCGLDAGVTAYSGPFSAQCARNEIWVVSANACVPLSVPDAPPKPPPSSCANTGYGKPIYPLTGSKRYVEDFNLRLGSASLSAVYDTLRRSPVAVAGNELTDVELGQFGELWSTSLLKKLTVGAGNRGARVSRGAGRSVAFTGDGTGVFTADADTNDRLVSIAGGWRYIDASAQAQETYNSLGQLTRIDQANGASLTYTYSTASTPTSVAPGPGYLLSVADQFARTLQFEYNSTGRISKITDPAGQFITPAYDSTGNLSQITWADTRVRRFLYENTGLPWAMTGITDENNVRHATIGYDPQGRAISTELAGGVNRYSASYTQPPVVLVTDTYDASANIVLRSRTWQAPVAPVLTTPNGSTIDLGIGLVANIPGITSRSQPAGSGW